MSVRSESEEQRELFLDVEDHADDNELDDEGFEPPSDVDDDEVESYAMDDEFHDAEEGDEEDEEDDEYVEDENTMEQERAAAHSRLIQLISSDRIGIGQRQLLNILRQSGRGHLLFDDDEDVDNYVPLRRRRRELDPDRFPKIPSKEGQELMNSGTFGATDIRTPLCAQKRVARRILDRELGVVHLTGRRVNQGLMAQSMIPTTEAEMTINYDEPVYSGQFSDDGNFFYACVKDFKVRMYDTSNPYNWRHYKTVSFPFGSWTLTDASLSPDNKWLAYTSIQSNVCLAPTDPSDTGDPYTLNLDDTNTRHVVHAWHRRGFGIWSIRFSGDGRELVAGTNANSIVVYDIESRQTLLNVRGHEDHVNAVCFADKDSPHLLYSGSDDATIKVWDRRSMGDRREAGAFVGHIEGLTYIDSKGDGRYILSNGKDQSMKLWDTRMMYSRDKYQELNPRRHLASQPDFDYRWGEYDDADWFPHPDDNSLVTFRGHKVLRTLIRCHFSPPGSTDSRYVYSGSHDGKIYVYNMDATIAKIIDVKQTTKNPLALQDRYKELYSRRGFDRWSTCVRDASWHPNAPFLAASSLNGWDSALGTVTVHSYNESDDDDATPSMGTGYNEKLVRVNSGLDNSDDVEYRPSDDELGEELDYEIGWDMRL